MSQVKFVGSATRSPVFLLIPLLPFVAETNRFHANSLLTEKALAKDRPQLDDAVGIIHEK